MKKILVVLLAMLMLLMTVGCSKEKTPPDTESKTASAPESKTNAPPSKKVAWLGSNLANEFSAGMAEYCESVGKEHGWKVVVFNADSDLDTQISHLETCATQGYAAILMDPVSESGLDAALKSVNAEFDIPLITIHGSVASQEALTAYVAMDMVKGGELEMQALADDLGGKGNICIITGTEGMTTANLITQGYDNVLKKYPDLKVVYKAAGDWGADSATVYAENWLVARKDIDAIICNNDGMALGVRAVISNLGLTGKIKLYGLDAISEARRYLRAGEIDASIRMDAESEFKGAFDIIDDFYAGRPFEKKVIIDPILITAENIDKYFPND